MPTTSQPINPPNYNSPVPQSAWQLARNANGSAVIYASSGRAFIKRLQRVLLDAKRAAGSAWAGTQGVYGTGIIGRMTQVNFDQLGEDGNWGPTTNGVLWRWAQGKGVPQQYLDAIASNAQKSRGQPIDDNALYVAVYAALAAGESWASFSSRFSIAPPEMRARLVPPPYSVAPPASPDGDNRYFWNPNTQAAPSPNVPGGNTQQGNTQQGNTQQGNTQQGNTTIVATSDRTSSQSTILGMSTGQAALGLGIVGLGVVGAVMLSRPPAGAKQLEPSADARKKKKKKKAAAPRGLPAGTKKPRK